MAAISYEEMGNARALIETLHDINDQDFFIRQVEVGSDKGDVPVGTLTYVQGLKDYVYEPED